MLSSLPEAGKMPNNKPPLPTKKTKLPKTQEPLTKESSIKESSTQELKEKVSMASQVKKSSTQKSLTQESKAQESKAKEPPVQNSLPPFSPPKGEKKETSAQTSSSDTQKEEGGKKREFCLSSLFAFKLSMSSLYNEKGQFKAVTFLEYKPWRVSQVKEVLPTSSSSPQSSSKNKPIRPYKIFQLCSAPQKPGRVSKALKTHLISSGYKEGASWVKEVKVNPKFDTKLDDIRVGDTQSILSLKKGDRVSLTSTSKGKGFAGVVKRWNFRGGPASHGAKTHRTGGSIGNRTEPARVMPGKKMPGHLGFSRVSIKNVKIVEVLKEKNLIIVQGSVPGSRNTLVYLRKQG